MALIRFGLWPKSELQPITKLRASIELEAYKLCSQLIPSRSLYRIKYWWVDFCGFIDLKNNASHLRGFWMVSQRRLRCCREPQESLWAWDRVFLLLKLWREHTSGLTLLLLLPLLQQRQPSCEFQSIFESAMNMTELSPIPLVHGDSETRPLAEHAKRLSHRYGT